MPKTSHPIAEGFGRGLVNIANQYAQRKAKEHEESRIQQLGTRLAEASEIEKAALLLEADPSGKTYVQYEIGREKNKAKQQDRDLLNKIYASEGMSLPSEDKETEATEKAGLGGEKGKVVQPLEEESATTTQPGFKVNAPQMAARNAIKLPGGLGLTANEYVPPPSMPATAPTVTSGEAPTTNKQRAAEDPFATAQRLRTKATQAESIRPGAGKGLFEQANAIEKKVKTDQASMRDNRDFAFKTNKDFNERVNGLVAAKPLKTQALSLAESAVLSGKVGPWSRNNLAKILNRPELEDASGAALNLAIKQNLLGTLSQVSAKATNKWLEQVALNAFAGVGKPEEANQTILEAIKTEHELADAEILIRDQVLQQDIDQTGAEQPYLQQRVNKILDPIQKDILQKGSFKTRVIYEKAEGYDQLAHKWNKHVPKGTPLTPQMGVILLQKTGDKAKASEYAKKLGYSIYPANKIREYEQ